MNPYQYLHLPKLALIDLDGVLIDCTVRFRRAEDLRKAHPRAGSKESWNYYWEEAMNPAFFHLDTEIAGTKEDLATLAREGYALIYISSRLEQLRAATVSWLADHSFPPPTLLLLKVNSFKYQTSVDWYGWMTETLLAITGCRELLVVSDKKANLDAIRLDLDASGYTGARYYERLSDIFDPAHGADDPDELPPGAGRSAEPDPFLPDFPDE